jgi:capsular polysaccharide biosynthesis protein
MEKTNELHNADGLLSFDPIVTVLDVLRRWFLILLVAVIVGVGAYIYKDASYTPSYRTSAVLVVTSRGSSTSVYNNLSSTSSIANLFTELLNSSLMRKTLMEEMGVSSLDAQITTAVIPNTNLITLSVTSSDPRTAFVTARTLLDTHEELTYAVVDGIIMEVLQQPSVPS